MEEKIDKFIRFVIIIIQCDQQNGKPKMYKFYQNETDIERERKRERERGKREKKKQHGHVEHVGEMRTCL